jgi:S1-C subfamily serine protease
MPEFQEVMTMRETRLKALVALGTVLLLSLSMWGFAAAQENPEGTPEATAEAAATERPFLGVRLEDVDGAVVIREIVAGSPAAEAGLQEGDEITAVNDTEVSSASDVVNAISSLAPGDEITIEYSREGESLSAQVTLGSAPVQLEVSPGEGRRGQGRGGERGLRGMGLLGDLSISYNSDDQSWTIESLSEDSALYQAGLREGDVITAINGEQYDPVSLMQFLMTQDQDITLTVERDGAEQEIRVSPTDLQLLGMGGMFQFGEGRGMPFGQGRGMTPDMMPFHMFGGSGWLGIAYVNLDEQTAEEQGVDVTEGALVTEVVADSPAEAGGLLVDDVITAVNGEAVDEEHTLRDRLIAYEPDDIVTLDILRGGETQQIEVTLGEPSGVAGMMPFFQFGDIPDDLIPAVPAPEVTAEPNV